MTDTNTTTTIAVWGMIAGAFGGVHIGAGVLGVIACICIINWLKADTPRGKFFAIVCVAGLLSGYGAPVVVLRLSSYLGGEPANEHYVLMGVLIGACVPMLLPAALMKVKARLLKEEKA